MKDNIVVELNHNLWQFVSHLISANGYCDRIVVNVVEEITRETI